jgi:hypothetical protein
VLDFYFMPGDVGSSCLTPSPWVPVDERLRP